MGCGATPIIRNKVPRLLSPETYDKRNAERETVSQFVADNYEAQGRITLTSKENPAQIIERTASVAVLYTIEKASLENAAIEVDGTCWRCHDHRREDYACGIEDRVWAEHGRGVPDD